ncbi:hypothetical protein LAZ67_22000837 [Cordylochernes scorpioides]|uniref:Uncharacterized protein n=1 Tax=Cordylochernes scorpioides TaxID=51811 RepID=A0ABY6LNK4_9ARAC|nr:hypothetical protein LAZ67_22000837 [Cordylochernes scorpioides]
MATSSLRTDAMCSHSYHSTNAAHPVSLDQEPLQGTISRESRAQAYAKRKWIDDKVLWNKMNGSKTVERQIGLRLEMGRKSHNKIKRRD